MTKRGRKRPQGASRDEEFYQAFQDRDEKDEQTGDDEGNGDDDETSAVGYFDNAIESVAATNRVLLGLYSLLTAAVLIVMFSVEVSPWGGALLLAALLLFLLGVGHASITSTEQQKISVIAGLLETGQEIVDFDETTFEEYADLCSRFFQMSSGQSRWLVLGAVCASGAVLIERWQYARRALLAVVGGGVLLLVVLLGFGVARAFARRFRR